MNKICLFENKSKCCGCGACMNICPRNAIKMQEDEYGYVYPVIDYSKCISCGLCKKVCSYQNDSLQESKHKVFASAIKENSILMESASGGMFVALAKKVIESQGVVFGATLQYDNNQINPLHIWIDDEKDLYKLQGSKYVQSEIGKTYSQVKEFLENGKKVMFSGTPCQIAGLKGYLQKDYTNLITVDLICHGVPNRKLFHSYITYYEKKFKGKIINYRFRDKRSGQGMTQAFSVQKSNGKIRVIKKDGELLAYMWEFLESNIYRENCYSCKYASQNRVSDITIGDFWGVNVEHHDKMQETGLSRERGISCLITNSIKGEALFDEIKENILYFESDIEKVAKYNKQLNAPSISFGQREKLLLCMKKEDYVQFDEIYRMEIGLKYYYYCLRGIIPRDLKRIMKMVMKR